MLKFIANKQTWPWMSFPASRAWSYLKSVLAKKSNKFDFSVLMQWRFQQPIFLITSNHFLIRSFTVEAKLLFFVSSKEHSSPSSSEKIPLFAKSPELQTRTIYLPLLAHISTGMLRVFICKLPWKERQFTLRSLFCQYGHDPPTSLSLSVCHNT